MTTPQPGIFAVGTRSHHHLQFDLDGSGPDGSGPEAVLDAVREVRDAVTTVTGVNLVVGLGADLARRVVPAWVPEGLEPFRPLAGPDGPGGPGHAMPADQHDLWLWLHGSGPDDTFDAALAAVRALGGAFRLANEQPCFAYRASRDMTGFEDGTENPPLDEAVAVATVPAGAPGAGGSVVLLQRWVHDLDRFAALPVPDQEQAIGRRKATSDEIDDAERSPRAHISRVVVEDEAGEELEVLRRSTPFGGVAEHGLQFLAFSADVARLSTMLRRMVGLDGEPDRLIDFTHSTGGAWYVAPPIEAFRAAD